MKGFMNDKEWLTNYISNFQKSIYQEESLGLFAQMRDLVVHASVEKKKVIFAGNGASASIASHCAVDYTKQAKVRSISFNEPDFITCFANDYGFEHWIEKAVEHYGEEGDVLVLISSSGKSANVVNAAKRAKELGLTLITFTGFSAQNPLKQLGTLNFWLDSRAYNIVECTHMFWLMAVCDLIIGKAEYAV